MSDKADKAAEEQAAGEDKDNIADLAEALEAAAAAGDDPMAEDGVEDPLEVLLAENEDLKDKALRPTADMENLRRRSEREKAEATLYAASNFARDMLGVSDNMDRALGAVSQEQRDAADDVTRTLLEGVELVQRELRVVRRVEHRVVGDVRARPRRPPGGRRPRVRGPRRRRRAPRRTAG